MAVEGTAAAGERVLGPTASLEAGRLDAIGGARAVEADLARDLVVRQSVVDHVVAVLARGIEQFEVEADGRHGLERLHLVAEHLPVDVAAGLARRRDEVRLRRRVGAEAVHELDDEGLLRGGFAVGRLVGALGILGDQRQR